MNLIFKDPAYYKRLVRAAAAQGLIRPMTDEELRQRYMELGIEMEPEMPGVKWINAAEAGAICERDPQAVHRYRRLGKIKVYKTTSNGAYLYALEEIQRVAEWIKGQPRCGRKGENHG